MQRVCDTDSLACPGCHKRGTDKILVYVTVWEHVATRQLAGKLTSALFLSSCLASLQGMPAFSAVDIMAFLAPSFIIAHKAGLSIAKLIACDTFVILPVQRT